MVDTCFQLGIHVTQIGSACIYTLSEEEIKHQPPFKETDEPFYQGSWYSRSRLLSELSIRHYSNLLLLRIRLPIAADLHKNSHIGRLLKYEKIVDLTGVGVPQIVFSQHPFVLTSETNLNKYSLARSCPICCPVPSSSLGMP